jgi:hypothetical protein
MTNRLRAPGCARCSAPPLSGPSPFRSRRCQAPVLSRVKKVLWTPTTPRSTCSTRANIAGDRREPSMHCGDQRKTRSSGKRSPREARYNSTGVPVGSRALSQIWRANAIRSASERSKFFRRGGDDTTPISGDSRIKPRRLSSAQTTRLSHPAQHLTIKPCSPS